ncbi:MULTISPECIES: COG1361 S-layer family protein [Haloferacaceae]|uniref:COG1361 S-layer family protein n=1 Tax=Halorubrum glutamatedens TaxID=2707018 RepID=A0ABD5QVU4_9EURY|nr:COG1361 S-layer family protein [Halobellus captivus]
MNARTVLVALVSVTLLTSGTAGLAVAAATGSGATASAPLDAGSGGEATNPGGSAVTPQQSGGLIRGSPDLAVSTSDPTLTPGRTNTVPLQVTNDGDLDLGTSEARAVVTTARNVRVEADAEETPLTVETGTLAIGSVTEDRPGEAPIAVSVPEDVDEGTYTIDVEVEYSYTYQQSGGVTIDRERTLSTEVDVEVDDDARFEITNATTDATVGGEGTVEAEVRNVGADAARDLTVVLESSSPQVGIGGGSSDTARIDEIAPNETRTVRYDVGFTPGASVREYLLDGTVTFETPEGYERADEGPSVGVTPRPEQRFGVDDVESDLYVGEQGTVYGTVTNEGPNEARNVVVRFAGGSSNVIPRESAVAVGTLAAGESGSFRFPLEINGEAKPIDRSSDLVVQYRNDENEPRAYEDVELLYSVEPQRDQFRLEVEEREVEAGGSVEMDVEVTNNLDETVTDVEARLFADSPLESDDDEAFAASLEPGESTTMTFDLSAESSGVAKTYPVSFDFRYDDADGNSQLSDTTRVPVTVVQAEESSRLSGIGTVPLVLGVLALVAVLGAGIYLTQRE